jgi:HSP20 family protein
MALRKEKKNKLSIKPTKKLGDITVSCPYDLWADMDRMFDDFRTQFNDLLWPWSQREELYVPDRTPLMDIADLGDKYEMHVEMPGIPKDDIEIEVTPNSIEICANHENSKEDKDKNWLRRERSSMSFYRSLELAEQIKSDNVDAEFKDGILKVMLPKVEPKPKHKASKVKIK